MNNSDSKFGDSDPGMDALIERHPEIFRGRAPVVISDCPPGWFPIVDRLLSAIEDVLPAPLRPLFEVRQLKEKMGTLRLYWRLGRDENLVVDVGFDGTHRRLDVPPAAPDAIYDAIGELVRNAERDSRTLCMKCGAPARMRVMIDNRRLAPRGYFSEGDDVPSRALGMGWFVVLCDTHADAQAARRAGLDDEDGDSTS